MCGIAGILTSREIESKNQKIKKSLSKRGEDHFGIQSVEHTANGIWTFYHSRLSIMDPKPRSSQPFTSNDKRYFLVFNGEIYNFRETRKKITNYNFRTDSDTEVLLAMLINEGVKCLNKLDGMFAFAFYDSLKKKLILARDRFGKKPLYFYNNDQEFAFSSNLESLLILCSKDFLIRSNTIHEFLKFQRIGGNRTIFEEIYQIKPGSYVLIDENANAIEKSFFNLFETKLETHFTDFSKNNDIRKLVTQSVSKRLESDVPFASLLSGGVDSTLISSLAAKSLGKNLNTFTLSFNEAKFDESKEARLLANHIGSTHHEINFSATDALNNIKSYFEYMDTPTADGLNIFSITKIIRENGFKMALTGLGGDEWFLGYPYFHRFHLYKHLSKIYFIAKRIIPNKLVASNHKIRRLLDIMNSFSVNDIESYSNQRILFDNNMLKNFFNLNCLMDLKSTKQSKYENFSNSINSLLEWKNYTYPILLKDSDQFSLANGVELRNPFMDNELVDFVLKLNNKVKSTKNPKDLLKINFPEILTPEIINRNKKGFTLPYEFWMKTELKDFSINNLESFGNRFNNNSIIKEFHNYLKDKSKLNYSFFWTVIALEEWLCKIDRTFYNVKIN